MLPIQPLAAPLTDGVVRVRLRRDDDLSVIAAAADDPEAAQWLEESLDVAPKTPLEIAGIWASGRAAPLMIADATTDEPAGLINLQFRRPDDATVAYRVFPAWRGRGFAARGLELVCGWAFAELGLSTLWLEIDEANEKSLRVAARCGFIRRGTTGEARPKAAFIRLSAAEPVRSTSPPATERPSSR